MKDFIKFDDVQKTYQMGKVVINAAKNISFSVKKGELVIVVGASGAGKTTVLNMLGGMDQVTDGKIIVDDKIISGLKNKELTNYRRYDIGFIFQFYNLVPNLTAKENVELAIEISKSKESASELLTAVGLNNRSNNFPSQLSGGEQQRVAIARALSKKPKLLLCDEPTGALDYSTGKEILKLLQDTSRKNNMTVIIVTHNQALLPIADRVIKMRDSQITEILINNNPKPVDLIEW
jgi:putative ABC transport system ATP-binding protein